MYDNEDIIITSGLNNIGNKNINHAMQSILCALEICKFIEYIKRSIRVVGMHLLKFLILYAFQTTLLIS